MSEKKNSSKIAPENLMYIGPSIEGMVYHSQVFEPGALPPKAMEAAKEFPQLNRMFVPLSECAEAINKINSSERNALKTIYGQCVSHFKGGK